LIFRELELSSEKVNGGLTVVENTGATISAVHPRPIALSKENGDLTLTDGAFRDPELPHRWLQYRRFGFILAGSFRRVVIGLSFSHRQITSLC